MSQRRATPIDVGWDLWFIVYRRCCHSFPWITFSPQLTAEKKPKSLFGKTIFEIISKIKCLIVSFRGRTTAGVKKRGSSTQKSTINCLHGFQAKCNYISCPPEQHFLLVPLLFFCWQMKKLRSRSHQFTTFSPHLLFSFPPYFLT